MQKPSKSNQKQRLTVSYFNKLLTYQSLLIAGDGAVDARLARSREHNERQADARVVDGRGRGGGTGWRGGWSVREAGLRGHLLGLRFCRLLGHSLTVACDQALETDVLHKCKQGK